MKPAQVHFYDHQPDDEHFLDVVLKGLGSSPKAIPPRFFYDTRGSELFEGICRQPEYYLPRAEREIFEQRADEIARLIGPESVLIEPGAGASHKVRLFLDQVRPQAYVPMDIAGDFLRNAADELALEFPWLPIHAVWTDFIRTLPLPRSVPDSRRVVFFPGSSLGNFDPPQALDFLGRLAALARPGGGLLIGVDLKKDPAVLNAAYNDRAGLTAAFNLNLLTRINRELGGDFDARAFRHHAFYNEPRGRIEMHLVSGREQTVTVGGHAFPFREDESIHTENSFKYSPDEFHAMAALAGFEPVAFWHDHRQLFGVYFLRSTSTGSGLES